VLAVVRHRGERHRASPFSSVALAPRHVGDPDWTLPAPSRKEGGGVIDKQEECRVGAHRARNGVGSSARAREDSSGRSMAVLLSPQI